LKLKKIKRGVVVSVIVKDGVLRVGQIVFAQDEKIKVRQLLNDLGRPVTEAYTSSPVEVLGFNTPPPVGSRLSSVEEKKTDLPKTTPEPKKVFNLESILSQPKEIKKLKVIIKTDSFGSLEAINASLAEKDNIEIILSMVGDINNQMFFS
jgi:translation initiation factor IF-2